jgi:hypothetical protein
MTMTTAMMPAYRSRLLELEVVVPEAPVEVLDEADEEDDDKELDETVAPVDVEEAVVAVAVVAPDAVVTAVSTFSAVTGYQNTL